MLIKLGLNDPAKQVPPTAAAVQADELEDALRELVSTVSSASDSAPVPVPETAGIALETPNTVVPEGVTDTIAYWITNFGRSPVEATRSLHDLFVREPQLTAEVLVSRFEAADCGAATAVVASLLSRNTGAFEKLCDPALSLESAISVAQSLATQEPRFDAHFAKNLLVDEEITEEALERGLKILEQLPGCARLIPILIQFLRSPNSRIRSRAALTLGRIAPASNLTNRLMQDADDRVRANFVEGLWKSPANHVDLFRQALGDRHHRVAGNALIGLHLAGETRTLIQHLVTMARNPEAPFRAAAAWVMGKTGDERFRTVLHGLMRDPDSRVRRGALIALRRIKSAQSVAPPVSAPPQKESILASKNELGA